MGIQYGYSISTPRSAGGEGGARPPQSSKSGYIVAAVVAHIYILTHQPSPAPGMTEIHIASHTLRIPWCPSRAAGRDWEHSWHLSYAVSAERV